MCIGFGYIYLALCLMHNTFLILAFIQPRFNDHLVIYSTKKTTLHKILTQLAFCNNLSNSEIRNFHDLNQSDGNRLCENNLNGINAIIENGTECDKHHQIKNKIVTNPIKITALRFAMVT